MQPEQNTGYGAPTQAPQAPQAPQVTSMNQFENEPAQEKPKKTNVMVIVVVILVIFAIGGIGFGVFMMTTKDQEIARLQSQIADLNSQLEKYSELNIIDDPEDNKNYVYLDDWGTKVEVPGTYDRIDYSTGEVTEGTFANVPGATILTLSTGEEGNTDPCNRASVIRVPKGEVTDQDPVFTKGDYDYFKDPSSGCEADASEERPAYVLEAMLTDPNNYSNL